MNETLIYSLLLSLALSGAIFNLAVGAGVIMKPYSSRTHLKSAIVFSLVNLLMAIFGYNIGLLISEYIIDFSVYVGHILTAFVGLKFVLENYRVRSEKQAFLYEDTQILRSLAIASSINTFLAFMGFGLIINKVLFYPAFILFGFIFLAVVVGITLGYKFRSYVIGKYVKLILGYFLIMLSLFLLFQ